MAVKAGRVSKRGLLSLGLSICMLIYISWPGLTWFDSALVQSARFAFPLHQACLFKSVDKVPP